MFRPLLQYKTRQAKTILYLGRADLGGWLVGGVDWVAGRLEKQKRKKKIMAEIRLKLWTDTSL